MQPWLAWAEAYARFFFRCLARWQRERPTAAPDQAPPPDALPCVRLLCDGYFFKSLAEARGRAAALWTAAVGAPLLSALTCKLLRTRAPEHQEQDWVPGVASCAVRRAARIPKSSCRQPEAELSVLSGAGGGGGCAQGGRSERRQRAVVAARRRHRCAGGVRARHQQGRLSVFAGGCHWMQQRLLSQHGSSVIIELPGRRDWVYGCAVRLMFTLTPCVGGCGWYILPCWSPTHARPMGHDQAGERHC